MSNESVMKKPTRKRIEWNSRHARGLFDRKTRHRRRLSANHRKASNATVSIRCPRIMSLVENFDGVIELLEIIRQQGNRQDGRVYINFKEIEEISPGAALVFAAELDRLNRVLGRRGRKLTTIDVEKWDRRVRNRLKDMGFFELLNAQATKMDESDASGIKYIRFRSGVKVLGNAIDDLMKLDLERIFGDDSIPKRHKLYAAVAEAMTNVVHHAYPDRVSNVMPNWWLSAAHNANTNEIRILLYDQGCGIPETLPKKYRERFWELVSKTDADLIRNAHDLARSASFQRHRGYGLDKDIRKYVQSVNCMSAYQVTSLRGQYTLKKELDGEEKISTRNYERSLPGTLIEWRLTLQ